MCITASVHIIVQDNKVNCLLNELPISVQVYYKDIKQPKTLREIYIVKKRPSNLLWKTPKQQYLRINCQYKHPVSVVHQSTNLD